MLAGVARLALGADLPDLQHVGAEAENIDRHVTGRQARGRGVGRGQFFQTEVAWRERHPRQTGDCGEVSQHFLRGPSHAAPLSKAQRALSSVRMVMSYLSAVARQSWRYSSHFSKV